MEKSKGSDRRLFKIAGIFRGFGKFSFWLSAWFERVAIIGIVGMIIATIIDVLGAKLFHKPLAAGTEVVYFLQVIAIAGGLAFAKIDGRHIRLEFVDSFPKKIRETFNFIAAVLGLGLFVILSWKSFEYAQALKNVNEITSASRIPIFPFVLWIGISCIPLCLVLLRDMANSAIEVIKR
jgi:TRAP-type C4-dicarboxylate transport system permease small subunit